MINVVDISSRRATIRIEPPRDRQFLDGTTIGRTAMIEVWTRGTVLLELLQEKSGLDLRSYAGRAEIAGVCTAMYRCWITCKESAISHNSICVDVAIASLLAYHDAVVDLDPIDSYEADLEALAKDMITMELISHVEVWLRHHPFDAAIAQRFWSSAFRMI